MFQLQQILSSLLPTLTSSLSCSIVLTVIAKLSQDKLVIFARRMVSIRRDREGNKQY